jgi:putative heme iron utilization protein
MDDNDRQLLQVLLTERRVATLAVTVDGAPFASLVPFAMTHGFGTALIHASSLARHSAGLSSGAPFSLLIHEPDTQPETNPAQLARATLLGSVEPLARDSDAHSQARDQYLAKFPKSQITFQLGDFTLYALTVESCRFVAGLGKAFDVSLDELAELA